ncbi:ABC transporter ATP-binding protein [Rubrivivax sp. A210]|uniref:ABC transporter ATP-binding protein n=1 Tax=Rubrivivax sp. A210 TaxID=2772301 RepID=UPI001918578E|nr:ATP-binding cassette domain-containing protein [Rubrivivax sp. A210]CAD5365974.1 ABC transporter ATP-binding protein [Rubrivivax sp. A210]
MATAGDFAIELQQIGTRFGSQVVHDGLDLAVRRGEILGLAGGSGSGKSVLLREMIGLQRPTTGRVMIFGADLATLTPPQALELRRRWGVMFQRGGLFGALNVRRNVGLPLREHSDLGGAQIGRLAEFRIAQTGLPPDAGLKLPDELSGGMLKRAALARAIALSPELLFLDEPTSGLDPASAAGVHELILRTHALTRPSIVIVSHDLDLLWQVCDRVAVLGEGRVLALDAMAALARHEHPTVRAYFSDQRRARASAAALDGVAA